MTPDKPIDLLEEKITKMAHAYADPKFRNGSFRWEKMVKIYKEAIREWLSQQLIEATIATENKPPFSMPGKINIMDSMAAETPEIGIPADVRKRILAKGFEYGSINRNEGETYHLRQDSYIDGRMDEYCFLNPNSEMPQPILNRIVAQTKIFLQGKIDDGQPPLADLADAWQEGAEWMYGHLMADRPGLRIVPNGSYFVAQCEKCGFKGSSEEWEGGGQIADTGDYGDSYCPVCGATGCEEAENDIYFDQRNLLLKSIGKQKDIGWLEFEVSRLNDELAALRAIIARQAQTITDQEKIIAEQADKLLGKPS